MQIILKMSMKVCYKNLKVFILHFKNTISIIRPYNDHCNDLHLTANRYDNFYAFKKI